MGTLMLTHSQGSSFTLLLDRDVEREVIASTTGVVDSVVDSVINGEGHTLVSPSSTEGVTTEDNSVEEVESPSETTGSISSLFVVQYSRELPSFFWLVFPDRCHCRIHRLCFSLVWYCNDHPLGISVFVFCWNTYHAAPLKIGFPKLALGDPCLFYYT